MSSNKKLLLIDAYAMIFKAYYAMLRSPRITSKGLNTSAIFGFVNILHEVLAKVQPTHAAVCFDPPGGTFRHEAYPEYKANRDATPEDIKLSVPYIKRILEAYRIPVIEVPRYEADDVVGTLAMMARDRGFHTIMLSPDKDYGQLVRDDVEILRHKKGGGFEKLGVQEICEKYEISSPLQVIDILALMGDSADNVPGCPKVGETTAIKLLKDWGSVENLIANTDKLKGAQQKNVSENVEQIKFSKFLVTIKTDVPVDFDEPAMERKDIDAEALRQVFGELEFRTLLTRVLGSDAQPAAPSAAPTSAPNLLDFEENTEETPTPQPVLRMLADTPHNFTTADSAHAVQTVVEKCRKAGVFGVKTVAKGDDAMSAALQGVALATNGGDAWFVPHSHDAASGGGDSFFGGLFAEQERDTSLIEHLRPLFEDTALTIVCDDVKRLIVLLRRQGIELKVKYFDTAIAHYLLAPERAHDLRRLAEDFLDYLPIDAKQGTESEEDKACELASVALALRAPLLKQVEEEKLTYLLNSVELPLVPVLADMEHTGVRVDVKALRDYSALLTQQMQNLEIECYNLAGEKFNTSSPVQVGNILFDKLRLDEKAKKTKSGQYSTTEEVLQHLVLKHPIVGKILELRGVRKLLSTYVNALPSLINEETGRIHTTFNQTVTATGRLSSTNPNMQNIPVRTDDGKEIRKAFIPASGNVFFSADYSQIELRLVADLSGDPTMVDAFIHDTDIHALTAAKIYHIPQSEVTGDQRRKAKTANFGILYGISAFGLAERLQIPRAEAKMLIEGYFATFPGVREYIDKCVSDAKEKGYVTTFLGRRRMLPDINSRNAVVRSFSERNAVNAPIQGSAADIIKIAMVRIFRRFAELGLKSKMILQVHDELNFDVVPKELPIVEKIVVEEMQNAYSGKVPLTASHSAAANWLDAH